MTVTLQPRPVPRFALTRPEAAESLGMSLDSFERYVQSDLRLIRHGKLRLVPVVEIERWVAEQAALTFERNTTKGEKK